MTDKKLLIGELTEKIDTLGQESDTKAVKWIQEEQKNLDKEEVQTTANEEEDLYHKRKYKKNAYYESLLFMAKRRLKEFDTPKDYSLDAAMNEKGIVIGIHKHGYKWYAKGMTICGEPKYDINCVERLTVQAMIALDELAAQHETGKTKSGISLPNRIIK